MMLFLDASALAARYLGGAENAGLRGLLREEQGEGCAISSISIPAFSQLLMDLKAEGIPEPTLVAAAEAFHRDLPDLVQVPVDPCLAQIGRYTLRYRLRMEPAIQLAAAMAIEDRLHVNAVAFPGPLVKVVTFDPALADAARKEGLGVWP